MKPEFEHLVSPKPDSSVKSSKKNRPEPIESKEDSPEDTGAIKRTREEMDPPKKNKSAFNFFVKAKRKDTEVELGEQMSVESLKAKLLEKWEALDQSGKAGKYNALAEEDKKRFDRENAEYQKYMGSKKSRW